MRAHTRLEVYWARLAHNWQRVRELAPQAKILPMIKANAYGHGLVPVANFLIEEMKAQALGVASLGEAEEVLKNNLRSSVLVFSDTMIQDREYHNRYASSQIIPVIHHLSDLEVFLSDRCFKHLPLVLKLNTGMNRLGIAKSQWQTVVDLMKKNHRQTITHLMSHFARASEVITAGDMSHQQKNQFDEAVTFFQKAGLTIEETSLANSGAIEQKFATDYTWVRPGLMLYGPPSAKLATQMVSSLVTQVLTVFPVERGVPVGYGLHAPAQGGVIAVLPLGYGDGYPTQSSGFKITVNGMTAQVFGRVNMDMTFLLFDKSAEGKIKPGDEVRFWDADPTALVDWATHMGTHSYQALCGVSSRVPRHYRVG